MSTQIEFFVCGDHFSFRICQRLEFSDQNCADGRRTSNDAFTIGRLRGDSTLHERKRYGFHFNI